MTERKLTLAFHAQPESVLQQVIRMAGTLTLPQMTQILKDIGEAADAGTLIELEMLVSNGTIQQVTTKAGLVLYRWPVKAAVVEDVDEDTLHERLYTAYGQKSFTLSKAAKELSLDRSNLEGLFSSLVKEGRLKEMGMRKFMGHPFQTYKVV